MNLQEAYSILELSEEVSPDDAKKKYRELTKKYHPDINKEPGAEDKFKKINEAYQCVQNGKGNDREPSPTMHYPFDPFGFNKRQVPDIDIQPIQTQVQISFKDSVLGCKRDIVYSRKIKCSECNGSGHVQLNNGCDKCGGRGQVTGRQGPMMFIQTCDKCGGRTSSRPCHKCKTQGTIDAESSVQVTIPGGISNGNILRLGGMGNYAGNFMGIIGMSDQYSDVFLRVLVIQEQGLSLDGQDVISSINISLLEALQGCKKTIKTIFGEKEIDIKALSKHKEEVIVPNLGVNGAGNQRILLNIDYPKDVSQLITALTNKEN